LLTVLTVEKTCPIVKFQRPVNRKSKDDERRGQNGERVD
jgi:hypothetical protein